MFTVTPTLGEGAGDVRIALNTEIFTSLLSCEGALSGILDSFVHETFSGGKPPVPQTWPGIAMRPIYYIFSF